MHIFRHERGIFITPGNYLRALLSSLTEHVVIKGILSFQRSKNRDQRINNSAPILKFTVMQFYNFLQANHRRIFRFETTWPYHIPLQFHWHLTGFIYKWIIQLGSIVISLSLVVLRETLDLAIDGPVCRFVHAVAGERTCCCSLPFTIHNDIRYILTVSVLSFTLYGRSELERCPSSICSDHVLSW